MPGTWPYSSDESDLEITHEYGEDTVLDVISTFPGIGLAGGGDDVPFSVPGLVGEGGDGQPKIVTVRKPRP